MKRLHTSTLVCIALLLGACSDDRMVSRPPYFAASTDLLDFGEVALGETEARTVFLFNKGELALGLSPPEGALLGSIFTLLGMEETVDPGGSVVVRVFFTPESEGPVEAEIRFPNDSVNMEVFALTVKGTGKLRDPCAGVVCNSPPRYCKDESTSAGFNPLGECVEGKCVYETLPDKDCPDFGCDEATGRCATDPCIGVTCTTPPNDCYYAQGRCERGACIYETNDGASCDDGNLCTDSPRCEQGTCRGVPKSCTQPSDPECADANTLRQYVPTGTCVRATGKCEFPEPTYRTCAHGCGQVTTGGVTQAACLGDPCSVLPPDYNPNDPCRRQICNASTNHQWVWENRDGNACTTSSSECPAGTCHAGQCRTTAGKTCTTNVKACGSSVPVQATCRADGRCVQDGERTDPCWQSCAPDTVLCITCYAWGVGVPVCLR